MALPSIKLHPYLPCPARFSGGGPLAPHWPPAHVPQIKNALQKRILNSGAVAERLGGLEGKLNPMHERRAALHQEAARRQMPSSSRMRPAQTEFRFSIVRSSGFLKRGHRQQAGSATGNPTAQPAMLCAARLATAAPGVVAAHQPRRQRRAQVVAAVSAQPTTQRLTKDDLVAYLASGCKPRDQWRCGWVGELRLGLPPPPPPPRGASSRLLALWARCLALTPLRCAAGCEQDRNGA